MIKENISMADGLPISTAIFENQTPQAIIQIIHGLKEHKERYFHFAEYLNSNGFTVFIADNRGHGLSISNHSPLGYMNGIKSMVEDHYSLTKYLKSKYPNVPVYMIGHSFGSLIARNYIQTHDNEIRKLVLSGTVGYVPAIPLGIILAKIITLVQGKYGKSRILHALADNGDISWVCSNPETMEQYKKDPFCTGYKYLNGAVKTIFESVAELHNYKAFKCNNPDMPILSITGELDPVTRGAKGVQDSINSLKKVGYNNVESIVYKDMLHEVLNEIDKEKVYKDVLDFLKK